MIFKDWKGLLVDLDGTLIDSIPILFRAYLAFMEAKGKVGSKEEFAALNGKAFPEIFLFLKNEHDLEEDGPTLAGHYHGHVMNAYQNESKLFDGAEQTLRLAHKKGKKILLVTSAPAKLAQEMLHRLNVAHYFSEVVSSEHVEHSKPSPSIYLKALKNAHLSGKEAVAIEDSLNGVKSSMGAGIPTIVYGSSLRLGEAAVAHNWMEIQQLLGLSDGF